MGLARIASANRKYRNEIIENSGLKKILTKILTLT